jgi:hypothetical protein
MWFYPNRYLASGQADRFAILDGDAITWTFVGLAQQLANAGYVEKISGSSETSGCNILSRLWAGSHDKKKTIAAEDPERIQEEEEAVCLLADE